MDPILDTVRVIAKDEKKTEVEIIYRADKSLDGVELHGVDAGLSWLKGESIQLEKTETDEFNLFTCIIELTDSCEFRARGYSGDDYWEGQNHKLTRLSAGNIIFDSGYEVLESINFESDLPEKFTPELLSVKLIENTSNSGKVIVTYLGSPEIIGMELHGVDGGLTWIKGESLLMKRANQENEENGSTYSVIVEIKESIEFKARGFDDQDEDYWEQAENSKIIRNSDGSINLFFDELIYSDIEFIGQPPLEYDIKIEDAITRLSLDGGQPTRLYQFLLDTSIWYDKYIENLYNQELFDLISRMMRYIKLESRKIQSLVLDDIIRPIVKSLYQIYTEAISFTDENIMDLVNKWQEDGLHEIFKNTPNKIREIEHRKLGDPVDAFNRTRHLWTYN